MNFISYIQNHLSQLVKTYRSALHASMIIIACCVMVSCADDLSFKSDLTEDDGITLTICIPNVEGAAEFAATRDDEPSSIALTEADEGKITNLWLYAFSEDGKNTKITGLTEQHSSLNVGGDYKEYKVLNFKPGTYHIYLLANLNRYLTEKKMAEIETKQDIEDLLLNFNPEVKIEMGTIPMYCLDTEIKIKNSGSGTPVTVENGILDLTSNTTIYADMTFLCAKVRYTVLFDRTEGGFSNQFSTNEIDFKSAQACKNPLTTKLYEQNGEIDYIDTQLFEYPSVTMKKVAYPRENDEKEKLYFEISKVGNDTEKVPDNLGSPSSWNSNTTQRAWQGVVYLPENLSKKVEETGTYIKLVSESEELQGMDLKFSPRQLKRGHMYDLVAKLKKSEFDVDFKVVPWTQQNIVYTLHGDYQLIVEHTDITVDPGFYFPMGYTSDTKISFEIPTVKVDGVEIPFYEVDPHVDENTKDENGEKYTLNPDFEQHFRIRINPEIPFIVLWDIEHDKDEDIIYKRSDVEYFHVVAGNLHKRIKVDLGHSPFLHVTPEVMTIDVKEFYLSGKNEDNDSFVVKFRTNYDTPSTFIDFKLIDNDDLVNGLGKDNGDLKLNLGDYIDPSMTPAYESGYGIFVKEGDLKLNLKDLISDHAFWSQSHELTLQFTLRVRNPHTKLETEEEIVREVKIYVKPFNTNYIIHFYDASPDHHWKAPHIFIIQDLLLPADLTEGENNKGETVNAHDYAGLIVGYIESQTTDNDDREWGAATQYVFTNNISFRGWKGYGGPDVNNPYDIYTEYFNNSSYERKGFVMLGEPSQENINGHMKWLWNYDYGYTERAGAIRYKRYRYDVNFNEDHEKRVLASYDAQTNKDNEGWACGECYSNYQLGSQYNGKNQEYAYPGIIMEKEKDNPGWWRYTLTGVAQPGKTMIMFCDTHAPWDDYGTDDNGNWTGQWNSLENYYRYPKSNDTGLPLFDFEDNEGWFVFKGKDNSEHFFHDNKPEEYK